MKYVIKFDVGDTKQNLVFNNMSIRSGGQKVLNSLPPNIEEVKKIKGVSVIPVSDDVLVYDVEVGKYATQEKKSAPEVKKTKGFRAK